MKKEQMARINLTMPKELIERWEAVADKIGMTRSAMLREMLEDILPPLEQDDVKSMLRMFMSRNGDVLKEMSGVIK